MSDVIRVRDRFDRIYLGDSVIRRLTLDVAADECTLELSDLTVLKEGSVDIFDPQREVVQPASLVLTGVRSLCFPEGEYFLNATIVDFDASPSEHDGFLTFSFTMTGGYDNYSFMRSLVVIAKDFAVSALPEFDSP